MRNCVTLYVCRTTATAFGDKLSNRQAKVQGVMNRDGTYSRIRRGGAFVEDGWTCRSACRLRYEPERRSDHIGFRIVAVRP